MLHCSQLISNFYLPLVNCKLFCATDEEAFDLKYTRTQQLIEYYGNEISSDPLYLLDQQSRNNFESAALKGAKTIFIEEYKGNE